MLRGCLGALALYAALAWAYFFWLSGVFEPPATYIGAAVAGFLVLCCLGAFANARTAWRDWSLIARATRDPQPLDGRLTAATGAIYPVREPLVAPFSRADCVICEYDLADSVRVARADDKRNAGSDYAGFLMVPCVVRSGFGEMRLLGYPVLEGFDEDPCDGDEAASNAFEYLTSTAFEDRSGLQLVTLFSVFGDVWTDDDGSVQKNLKLRNGDPRAMFPAQAQRGGAAPEIVRHEDLNPTSSLAARGGAEGDDGDEEAEECAVLADDEEAGRTSMSPRLREKRVSIGEDVCVIGVYDEVRRGLLPPSRGRHPNRLLRGSADQIIRRLRGAIMRNACGGLLALAVIHAAIYAAMQLYLRVPK